MSRIFRPYGLAEHNSAGDIAMCVSLCTTATVREHLAHTEWFINVMSKDKYLDDFWTPKHYGHFLGTNFWLAFGFGLDRIWEMSESYTTNPNQDTDGDTDIEADRQTRHGTTVFWMTFHALWYLGVLQGSMSLVMNKESTTWSLINGNNV